MREIKFRAYFPNEARMGKKTILQNVYSAYEGQSLNELIKQSQDIDIILVQYTGLKDIKGTEIYEGNIVHIWSEYDKGQRIYDEGNWEVYWRNDRWHLRCGEEEFDNGDYYQGDECPWPDVDNWKSSEEGPRMKIIGNIYENPKLLEKQKA